MKGSKIDMLPGRPHTPEVLLHKLLERVKESKILVVIEMDGEGLVNIYNTQMTFGDAAWMKSEFNKRFE